MDSPQTPKIKRKYEGYQPEWEIARDIENTYFRYMGINITSYLSKYEDIRAPVKERKKKREIDILSPAIRKLQFMDN